MGALLALLALLASPPVTVETASCERGRAPSYFVPGGDAAIIGCARLGVSGKPVELSANIGRADQVCVNPAFRGRGQMGIYIPARCVSPAALGKLRIVASEVPRQAVRGYELVVWGTAPASTRRLVVHHPGGRATAAVFRVRRGSVFIAELPAGAAGRPLEVRAWPRR